MSNVKFRLLIFAVVVFGRTIADARDDQGRDQSPKSWKLNARINDVFFVDQDHGWAVGDQGLILRTTNGGLHWQMASDAGLDLDDDRSLEDKISNMRPVSQTHELDPITCSLRSVHFINEHRGWISGSYYTPLLNRSHSVILRTEDGGKTWDSIKNSLLPEISRIHFQHVLGGWAIGSSNSLYRSGILTTASGGASWTSQTIEPAVNLIDGDLVPSGFVVVDDKYRLGKIAGQRFEIATVPAGADFQIHSVRMFNDRIGWAVGSSGTILSTKDGGSSWNHLSVGQKHKRMLQQFDFATIHIAGGQVFVAGNPGSILFSFPAKADSDRTPALELKIHHTGNSAAVTKVHFIDEQTGWAAGDLGTIMATSDAGETWRVQRGSESRVAILAVANERQDLPLAFLSRYSGDERYLSSVVLVEPNDRMDRQMATAASSRVGASSLVELVSKQSDRDTRDVRLESLVKQIRCQKPNVIVCSSTIANTNSLADPFVAMVRNAIELASNPGAYHEQIVLAGLQPWSVDRLMVRTDRKDDLTLRGERFLTSSGILLQDQIAIARGLAGLNPVYHSDEHYRVESFTGTVSAVGDDILYGLETMGRQIPRRDEDEQRGSLGSFATSPLKLERMKEILALADNPANQHQVESMIRGYGGGQDAREQGIWLWQLADQLLRDGRNELAAYTLDQLTSRFHNHSLTPAAIIWLANHYFSSELDIAIGEDLKTALSLVDTSIQHASKIETSVGQDGVTQVKWQPNKEHGESIDHAQFIENAVEAVRKNRIQKASAYLNRLKQRDPDLALSEPVRFMEAKLSAKIPGPNSSDALFKTIRRMSDLDSPFRFASSRELKVAEPVFKNSLPVCFKAEQRPLLDGRLDDDVWQNALEQGLAQMKVVTPAGATSPTNTDICWLAYDEQFLYVAARCCVQATHKCQPLAGVRKRDSKIDQHDRLRLELDTDRDLQSSFVFEVDAAGRAADRCTGSSGWNPRWYIAARQDDKNWSVECAIPLDEIVADGLDAGDVVAYRLGRLDCTSINLWADPESRTTEIQLDGIVKGLKIEPNRYEFIRIGESDFDRESPNEVP